MEKESILESLNDKVSQILQKYNEMKSENDALRNEVVALKSEKELKDKEVENLLEQNALKDMEIEDIVNKIENILS